MVNRTIIKPEEIESFCKESLLVSGIREVRGGDFEALMKQYIDVTSHMIKGRSSLNLLVTNHGLLNGLQSDPGAYRSGIPALDHGLMPKSEYIKKLCGSWEAEADVLISTKGKTENSAQQLYFKFMCIRPFRNANGRTGRLIYNILRIRTGQTWKIITFDEARKEAMCFREYRDKTFIPCNEKFL